MRSFIRLICLAIVLTHPTMAIAQQPVELRPMTAEQRWDRASRNLILFVAMFMHEGRAAGKTDSQIGRELASYFGPWPASTPLEMAQLLGRNWQLWRSMDFQATLSADGSVSILTNRPYGAALGDYKNIGVDSNAIDTMFGAFHQAIAERQGLVFEQTVDEDTVRMTIRRKP